MSSDWIMTSIGEITNVVTKGTTPTSIGFHFREAGINYVKSESITFDGRIEKSKFAFIDSNAHDALKRSQLQRGDILFSMAGVYIGKTAVVKDDILPANTNQAVGIIRINAQKAHSEYIDFCLRNPALRTYANSLVAQSAQPNLNLAEIKGLPINLPPLWEQKAIAHILGTLDDKIELNRKTNETLEAMAKALFKSWFVDFDPVRAKAESRPTGLPAEISDLFPDSFEDSELGEIPSGWRDGEIQDIAELNPETWGSRNQPLGVRYLDLSNVKHGRIDSIEEYQWEDAPSRARRILKTGDTVLGTVRPGNGSYCLIGEDGITGLDYA